MNYDNIICIQCNEKLKNFKNIIIHFIMHKNLCPFCVASYKSHKQFYDGNGHFNNKKCKSFQSLIITNKEKRDSFYKKLKDITGEKLIYPTKDSDDPCNHLYAQNQDELLYEENNQNNQTNDNEENETIGLQYSDDENIEIESAQNEPAINIDNEQNKLNEIEIEFLMLGIDNSMILLRIFSDSMQCNNKKDYTIMVEIENYIGDEFKKNKLLLFVVPNDWLQNFHQTIRALFSTLLGNGFNLQIGNEQIDVGTIDIPEFRTSCKLNGHNSNEYACHTCDKSRDGLFICQAGTLRKQEDITNFHSTKPKYDELYNDIELNQVWEKKAKEIGIKGVDRGKGRDNRSILYYILILIKNQISNDDFLIMEQLLTICFRLYSDSFDDNDLNLLQVLIESFNQKVNLITETELMNFHLLLHYPIYIKNWGAPKYTSAETFEAQLSRIKNFLNNNTNNRDEQYQRVTTLNMVKFFNSVDKLKSIEDESTTLIMGNKINNLDNLNNTKLKINSLFKNYQHLTFPTSIKNNKEVYNVGDAIEVASDNVLSGRWDSWPLDSSCNNSLVIYWCWRS
ncbi:hypothetical protein ACTFIW_000988 [Dictyostelium discoideum]